MTTRTIHTHDGRTLSLGAARYALTLRAAERAINDTLHNRPAVVRSENVGLLLNAAQENEAASCLGAMPSGADVFVFDGTARRWDRATVE